METVVYGEIVQMNQDRIIPIFRCQVVKTIVSQYCGHRSTAGVTCYIRFREPKPLEAWECRQARTHRKVVISGRTIQATIGEPNLMLCSSVKEWMMEATAKPEQLVFPTERPWEARWLKGCMTTPFEKNSPK
jgi:hypothetical protein